MRLQAYKLGTPQKNTLIQKIHFGNQNLKAVGPSFRKIYDITWSTNTHFNQTKSNPNVLQLTDFL